MKTEMERKIEKEIVSLENELAYFKSIIDNCDEEEKKYNKEKIEELESQIKILSDYNSFISIIEEINNMWEKRRNAVDEKEAKAYDNDLIDYFKYLEAVYGDDYIKGLSNFEYNYLADVEGKYVVNIPSINEYKRELKSKLYKDEYGYVHHYIIDEDYNEVEKSYPKLVVSAEKVNKLKENIDSLKDELNDTTSKRKTKKLKSKIKRLEKKYRKKLGKLGLEKPKLGKPNKNTKEKIKKTVAFSAGVVTGVALSCVPGVGTVRMGIAGVKLVSSVSKSWMNKHPEGKLSKISKKIHDKFPKITSKIDAIKQKLEKIPINSFLNGVSVGYIAGNVFEMITGNTVLDAISDAHKPTIDSSITHNNPNIDDSSKEAAQDFLDDHSINENSDVAKEFINDSSPKEVTDRIIKDKPFKKAKLDLRSIEYGKVSSTSKKSVHLLRKAGKNVIFDKQRILSDGTKMWHFKQANGLGYAWFYSKDVIAATGKSAKEIVKLKLTK